MVPNEIQKGCQFVNLKQILISFWSQMNLAHEFSPTKIDHRKVQIRSWLISLRTLNKIRELNKILIFVLDLQMYNLIVFK